MATDTLEEAVTSAGDTTFQVAQADQSVSDIQVPWRVTRTGARDAGMTPAQGQLLVDAQFLELQYRQGKLRGIPKPRPSTARERAELERLSRAFAGGKTVTEIVREDRGSVLP